MPRYDGQRNQSTPHAFHCRRRGSFSDVPFECRFGGQLFGAFDSGGFRASPGKARRACGSSRSSGGRGAQTRAGGSPGAGSDRPACTHRSPRARRAGGTCHQAGAGRATPHLRGAAASIAKDRSTRRAFSAGRGPPCGAGRSCGKPCRAPPAGDSIKASSASERGTRRFTASTERAKPTPPATAIGQQAFEPLRAAGVAHAATHRAAEQSGSATAKRRQ